MGATTGTYIAEQDRQMGNLRHHLVLAGVLASLAFACTAADDANGTSEDALTGSLASAKACAVRDAYASAGLEAFLHLTKAQLPEGVTTANPTSVARFSVTNIGQVFVVEEAGALAFYDANGGVLARAAVADTSMTWYSPTSQSLTCDRDMTADGGVTVPPPPLPVPDASAPAPATCLATAPIDATQFVYTKSTPLAANACSPAELAALSNYYRANAGNLSVEGWRKSVSETCSACVFTSDSAPAWSPIVVREDNSFRVNRGGCIEAATQNEACGRAYQQYQDCTLQACLKECRTQAEFNACRTDLRVTETACKTALENVQTSCLDGVAPAELACKGNSYTFEGPIKMLCMGQ